MPISIGADGFYHPQSEAELKDLVVMASEEGRQCRVRGSAHSVAHVIYGDQLSGVPNEVNHQTPAPGVSVQIMLDRYRGFRVKDEARKMVDVDAGIHLGEDPSDPTGTATFETSLVGQLREYHWALSNLGGVTHQTVSGFTATGSSGGSVQHSMNDNLWGFRVIDASGNVQELSRQNADFYAMAPNLGLLGAVSTLIFECEDEFNVSGQEAITTIDDCAIELFGPETGRRPSLEQFLRDTDYARLLWWPQRGAERVQVWQARRIRPRSGFRPKPYEEFGGERDSSVVFISLLYTILGNLGDLSHARAQFERIFEHVGLLLARLPLPEALGPLGEAIANFVSVGAEKGVAAAIAVLEPFAPVIEDELPTIFPQLLAIFIRLDSEKAGPEKGQPQRFKDYWWRGLPMDNEGDDVLLRTAFTEIWVPLRRTRQVMELLRSYFEEPTDVHEAYRRTGLYGWELYAAKPTCFWMSASHTEGEDEWKDGVFRIDPFWFAANPGDPAETFYPQFWELLGKHQVPFRLHWGKYQPAYEPGDRSWVNFFKAQYPRWEDFLALRSRRDPTDTFLTSYWRERFGL